MAPHCADDGEEIDAGATSVPQFSGVMPPIATEGTVITSLHQARSSGVAWCFVALLPLGKKAPKAT